MKKLVELADIELDKASQTLAALLEQHDQEKKQLDSLVRYTEEYLFSFTTLWHLRLK